MIVNSIIIITPSVEMRISMNILPEIIKKWYVKINTVIYDELYEYNVRWLCISKLWQEITCLLFKDFASTWPIPEFFSEPSYRCVMPFLPTLSLWTQLLLRDDSTRATACCWPPEFRRLRHNKYNFVILI